MPREAGLIGVSITWTADDTDSPPPPPELLDATLADLLSLGIASIELRAPGGRVLIEAEPVERRPES